MWPELREEYTVDQTNSRIQVVIEEYCVSSTRMRKEPEEENRHEDEDAIDSHTLEADPSRLQAEYQQPVVCLLSSCLIQSAINTLRPTLRYLMI